MDRVVEGTIVITVILEIVVSFLEVVKEVKKVDSTEEKNEETEIELEVTSGEVGEVTLIACELTLSSRRRKNNNSDKDRQFEQRLYMIELICTQICKAYLDDWIEVITVHNLMKSRIEVLLILSLVRIC